MNRLFIFNPDCELAIANGGRYYMPPGNIVRMIRDLAFLPAFLADRDDMVLVEEKPGLSFMREMNFLGVAVRTVLTEELDSLCIDGAEPWGLSPRMCHWLAERGWAKEWEPLQKELYSRKKACEGLEYLIQALPFVDRNILPQVCSSIEEIECVIKEDCFMAKAPWSSSGKGLLRLSKTLEIKEREWLSGILRRQGYVMVERYLDKVYDFAMEFRGGQSEMEFMGWSAFQTGENGEYRGNYIGEQAYIEKQLIGYLGIPVVKQLQTQIGRMLAFLLPSYRGYLGVDMMVYRNQDREYCVQPCVEINVRCNMGIVALFLSQRYLAPGSSGIFRVDFFPGRGEALKNNEQLHRLQPLLYKDNRIKSGYLNLTPVTETTHFVASVTCY